MKKVLIVVMILNVFSLVAQATTANGDLPVLSNFRIESNEPSRVYFDSSEEIFGSSKKGFTISGKTISKLTINSGQTIGHYFIVGTSFTFWDNNTIRYEGGSSIQDLDDNGLLDFTMNYIQNNITISEGSTKEIYVNASVPKSGNGKNESQAFKTLQEGINALPTKGGGKIWVKAGGMYNEGEIKKIPRGTSAMAPNVIEGYKDTPGDITSIYYTYVVNGTLKALDPKEMPLFDGGNRANGLTFCDLGGADYYIWKNIQVTNYKVGFRTATMTGFVADNVLIKDMGSLTSSDGFGFKMESNKSNSNLVRIKNTVVINATHNGIKIMGQHGLIDNSKVYCNEALERSDLDATTDYYFIIAGSDNIIRNSLAYKDTPNGWGHNGHGFSLKTQSNLAPVYYNLIEHCTAINIYGSFQARHINCKYNVFKDSESHADISNRKSSSSDQATGGIQFISGGSYNIFERLYIHDVDVAISWIASGEWDSDVNIQQNSIIRNCVFDDVKVAIRAYHAGLGGISEPSGNKIYNCTFNNIDAMYRMTDDKPFVFTGNEFKNVIFNNIPVRDAELPFSGGWSYENSNFYNSWTIESGTGNVNLPPDFEDKSKGDFRLKPDSPMIDKGRKLEDVKFDFENNARSKDNPHDIGAFEYQDRTTGSIKANAGEDQTICSGESITLTASGGTAYEWSTGETTASIKVNPTTTETYTVTVKDGSNTDKDDVTVTVNIVTANAGVDKTIDQGESVKLTASGGDSYLWNTGETTESISVSPNETTAYTVSVTKNNCTDTDSVQVTVKEINISNPPLTVASAGDDVSICLGESITLNASGGDSYTWSTGDLKKDILVNPTRTTIYTLTAKVGSITTTDTVVVSVENCNISSTNQDVLQSEFEVYPNPSKGDLNLRLYSHDKKEMNVELINTNGAIVYKDKIDSNQGSISKQIDISRLSKGIYFIRLFNSDQNMIKKILVI